jgi:hypothetical protein
MCTLHFIAPYALPGAARDTCTSPPVTENRNEPIPGSSLGTSTLALVHFSMVSHFCAILSNHALEGGERPTFCASSSST